MRNGLRVNATGNPGRIRTETTIHTFTGIPATAGGPKTPSPWVRGECSTVRPRMAARWRRAT